MTSDSNFDDATFDDEENETDESDRELQIAFQKGYLKPGLNIVQPVFKKNWINNVSGLQAKLVEFQKDLAWIETMSVTVPRPVEEEEGEENATQSNADDFRREISFIKQAQAAVSTALPMLHKMKIITKRPEDYFAEMAKSDKQMKRVRENLLNLQVSKQRSEAARRLRDERKFAVKIQREVNLERQSEKKQLMEAVKKHKKGMKNRLDEMINERKNQKPTSKRSFKDSKYGYGGKKKHSRSNTAESSADYSEFDSSKFSKPKANRKMTGGGRSTKGGGSKKQKRPGKNRRANIKSRTGKKKR